MTKKTITVYSLLFLCAFAFGLSFTLATNVQAEYVPSCCVVQWCPGYEGTRVGIMGHMVDHGYYYSCDYDPDPPNECDMYYQCPPV
jgi:hypothetical protein